MGHLEPLEYVEDFAQAWRSGTDEENAELRAGMRSAREQGTAVGGPSCCGTTSQWHRPWCELEPKRYRNRQDDRRPPLNREHAWLVQRR